MVSYRSKTRLFIVAFIYNNSQTQVNRLLGFCSTEANVNNKSEVLGLEENEAKGKCGSKYTWFEY